MQTVPLSGVPSQNLRITLNGQACQISVYTETASGVQSLYIDLSVNNIAVLTGVICLDRVLIVRESYFGFLGDLSFVDTQGTSDPTYDGLGSRYQLVYYLPSDLS